MTEQSRYELSVLDPGDFPDRQAALNFVRSSDFSCLFNRIEDALLGKHLASPEDLQRAREAAHYLAMDLRTVSEMACSEEADEPAVQGSTDEAIIVLRGLEALARLFALEDELFDGDPAAQLRPLHRCIDRLYEELDPDRGPVTPLEGEGASPA